MGQDALNMPADSTAILRTSLLYGHLDGLGLCGHVRCWFLRKVDGSAGGLVVDNRAAFLEALQATGRLCQNSSKGRMLHGGHRSFREMATASGHALHVTPARGDYLWMHLDRVSPSSAATGDERCRYRARQALAHIRRDVVPLLLRSQASVPKETVPGG
jgi:hypothetical protein